MDKATLIAHRLARQGLARPARDEAEYRCLARRLQPIAPVYFSRPGSPPQLVHRAAFDERALADRLRAQRELVKGRFWDGNIGYVLAGDLELYARAFRRPLKRLTQIQEKILQTLKYEGPLSPRQLREETGVRHKLLMPALHRLQQAFLVYEDQEDNSWERPFALFAAEWPGVDLERQEWEAAAAEVLARFLDSQVFATAEQVKDWSQWPARALRRVLGVLERAGQAVCCQVRGLGQGWMLARDQGLEQQQPGRAVYMLHKADPLVKAHQSELKRRFAGEVLQYLFIDGEFKGAVRGHWRIGPHDVEDIALDLPRQEAAARREEILAEVAREYHPPRSKIRRYAGWVLK